MLASEFDLREFEALLDEFDMSGLTQTIAKEMMRMPPKYRPFGVICASNWITHHIWQLSKEAI